MVTLFDFNLHTRIDQHFLMSPIVPFTFASVYRSSQLIT